MFSNAPRCRTKVILCEIYLSVRIGNARSAARSSIVRGVLSEKYHRYGLYSLDAKWTLILGVICVQWHHTQTVNHKYSGKSRQTGENNMPCYLKLDDHTVHPSRKVVCLAITRLSAQAVRIGMQYLLLA